MMDARLAEVSASAREGAMARFGSLAEGPGVDAVVEQVSAGLQAGNIHLAGASAGDREELTESGEARRAEQDELLVAFEQRRLARSVNVPTDDAAVRAGLRELGEPITLFGERQYERRERLRVLYAKLDASDGGVLPAPEDAELLNEAPEEPELFYTEASAALVKARGAFVDFSLSRAEARLEAQKRKRGSEEAIAAEKASCARTVSMAKQLENECSELGDSRPVSACSISPDGSRLLTGSWSGQCKLWAHPSCSHQVTVRAHEERVTGACFHPRAPLPLPPAEAGGAAEGGEGDERVCFATGSADTTARVWSPQGKLLRTFAGHTDRLARVAFHPHGSALGTASYDLSWRLWDVETGAELLCQEGHCRAVYAIAFHPDGSLAASSGLEGNSRVWDLRTGRCVHDLVGHAKQVLSVDFSPNGFHVATGAGDHTVKIWDLRKRQCVFTIAAHSNLVSQVRFEPEVGNVLVSSSYDCTVKVWSARDFRRAKTLSGHENRVMATDIAVCEDALTVVSCAYDRSIKIWRGVPLDDAAGPSAMEGVEV